MDNGKKYLELMEKIYSLGKSKGDDADKLWDEIESLWYDEMSQEEMEKVRPLAKEVDRKWKSEHPSP